MNFLAKPIYELSRAVKIIETESRMVAARSWREGRNGEDLINEYQVWEDENILEMSYTTMLIYLTPLTCMLRNS